jgi:hypothetical protein
MALAEFIFLEDVQIEDVQMYCTRNSSKIELNKRFFRSTLPLNFSVWNLIPVIQYSIYSLIAYLLWIVRTDDTVNSKGKLLSG